MHFPFLPLPTLHYAIFLTLLCMWTRWCKVTILLCKSAHAFVKCATTQAERRLAFLRSHVTTISVHSASVVQLSHVVMSQISVLHKISREVLYFDNNTLSLGLWWDNDQHEKLHPIFKINIFINFHVNIDNIVWQISYIFTYSNLLYQLK